MNSIEPATSAEALRSLLRERFPEAHAPPRAEDGERLVTGCQALDRIGLGKGSITEVVQERASSGGALLLAQLIEGSATEGLAMALIDGRDSFNPEDFSQKLLHRLLWIRATSATESLKAADLLLRDGNLPLVAMDLALNPQPELRRIPSPSWYRLRSLAEETSTTFIAITPTRILPTPHLRLLLQKNFTLSAFEHSRYELETTIKATRQGYPTLERVG